MKYKIGDEFFCPSYNNGKPFIQITWIDQEFKTYWFYNDFTKTHRIPLEMKEFEERVSARGIYLVSKDGNNILKGML